MADLVTGGRLELGLARGAYTFEYERIGGGIDATSASERLREMVPALRGLWKGDYAHDGNHWKFPSTTAIPKPPTSSGPPLWIAARDPASFEFATTNACNIQITPLWNDDAEVETLVSRYRQTLNATTAPERPKLMLLRHVFVGETEDELEQGARDLGRFYCNFATWFQNKHPVSQGQLVELTTPEIAAMDMFTSVKMRNNLVIGTPSQVVERLQSYQALGVDEFSLWLDSGMTFAAKQRSLELFIDKVMPAFDETGER